MPLIMLKKMLLKCIKAQACMQKGEWALQAPPPNIYYTGVVS